MNQRGYQSERVKTWHRIRIYALFGALLLGNFATSAVPAIAQSARTASLGQDVEWSRSSDLPPILSPADAAVYRRIFTLQEQGDWAAADHDIGQLGDPGLLGTVLGQRYLHRNYRARYSELRDWLTAYGDQPEAHDIYALARKRQPNGSPKLPQPKLPLLGNLPSSDANSHVSSEEYHNHSRAQLDRIEALKTEIRRLAPIDPLKAKAILERPDVQRLFDDVDQKETRSYIDHSYAEIGDLRATATLAGAGHNIGKPNTEWRSGLAAWRLGRYVEARQHFENLAQSANASNQQIAGAAFWSARSELRSHRPELVNHWLGLAANYPHSFYGLLARKTLGVDTYFNFEPIRLSDIQTHSLLELPATRRALALIQVGEASRAERELRALVGLANSDLLGAIESLANQANLPAMSLQLAALLSDNDGRDHDGSFFPVPHWAPIGGFTVDRALLFALMRQESQFLPGAESASGAVGLMQIMPSTAKSMARRIGISVSERRSLNNPEINLSLAQEYISALRQDDRIKNNLVLLAAAYNSGPGPIQNWLTDPIARHDPLLFLENIPTPETRLFAEKVLTNYWIYRQRLGQPTPDLDALAEGRWPIYTAMDPPGEGSRYASNR